jgi:putative ABC transport system ATP-binding protein
VISAVDIARYYTDGEREVHALDGVTLQVARNEFVAITGPSGCGKSTLMHLLGGLDTPSRGELHVDGIPLHSANDATLTDFRRHRVGIVFQFFNLLPTMNVIENVAFPLMLDGVRCEEAQRRALELVTRVGLRDRAEHFVHQLSGGEQQRTAFARALIHRPSLVLADEPTGNLDSHSAEMVVQLLQEIASENSTTLLVVTHSAELARAARRQIEMRDGRIVADSGAVA